MVVGRWWQDWRRSREDAAVARRSIPDDLWKRTLVRFPFLRRQDAATAAELRRLTSLFLDRKEFSAAGGLRLTDAIVVSIAAQAVLPVLRLGLACYDDFVGIVVHPDEVLAPREVADEDGVVHTYDEPLVGEAMPDGPVTLTWRAVRAAGGATGSAYNVVIHEFAHKLDMADGMADGVPLLPAALPRTAWKGTLQAAYDDFVRRLDAQQASVVDPYGSESVEEFFAVASEAFFVLPNELQDEHPALYAMFARYYQQDPAAEMPPPARRA
jgi:MtfA peptidase